MNHTANSRQAQQRFICSLTSESDCQSVFNLLTSSVSPFFIDH